MGESVFLNGEFIAAEQAFVSIGDRGFQFGDGIYEVIWCYQGRAFRLNEHIERLLGSAAGIRLELPYGRDELVKYVKQMLTDIKWEYASVYIQATRGPAVRTHAFPSDVQPTVIMYVNQGQGVPTSTREAGIATIIVPDTRGTLCNIKSVNLLPNVLARQAAVEAGAGEALFERDGIGVVEGAASNIFAVRDGVLSTGPLSPYTLPGVTRDCVLQLAKSKGLPVALEFLSREELITSSEVFITSTSKEVLAVTDIAGHVIGNGRPGPVTLELADGYRVLVERECGIKFGDNRC
ncbi:MAG: D-amino acid aminotransferase [Firmicutes bacterium]|nr:D-amino acid aminotransferase [Bacillota bacterium]